MLARERAICCDAVREPELVGLIPCFSSLRRGREHVIAAPLKELILELN